MLAQADTVRGILAEGPHAAVPVRAAKLCAAGVVPAATVTESVDARKGRLAPA